MPSAAKPDLDPLADLRRRYIVHLATLGPELGGAMEEVSATRRGIAIAALAHPVAGTSGSLGFDDVSRAAFLLEAAAQEHERGLASLEHLRIALAAMLDAIDAVVLSAV